MDNGWVLNYTVICSRWYFTALRDQQHEHSSSKGLLARRGTCQKMPLYSFFKLTKGLDAFECQIYGLPVLMPRPRWSVITCTQQIV